MEPTRDWKQTRRPRVPGTSSTQGGPLLDAGSGLPISSDFIAPDDHPTTIRPAACGQISFAVAGGSSRACLIGSVHSSCGASSGPKAEAHQWRGDGGSSGRAPEGDLPFWSTPWRHSGRTDCGVGRGDGLIVGTARSGPPSDGGGCAPGARLELGGFMRFWNIDRGGAWSTPSPALIGRSAAVIGSGVVGLTSARELQRREIGRAHV